jgi:autotransporter-associated beta strand protein
MEVKSGTVTFSGQSDYSGTTLVSGGTLVLEGAQRLSASSALAMNGGTLSIQNAGSILDQVFASLSLLDDSVIHLRSTALTFMGLGDVVAGKSLSVLDDAYGATPDSTIRFIGDFSQSQDFLALMSGLSINQRAVSFYFDGIYTDVRMVPEPGTTALMLAGLAMLGAVTRRRKAKALAA